MDDPILYWNAVALDCNRLDHTEPSKNPGRHQRGPTLSSRALAMTHIAMHDAYVLARAGLGSPVAVNDPYLRPGLRPAFSMLPTSVPAPYAAAAVAAAAGTLLQHLYPAHAAMVVARFDAFCAQWGADAAGHRFGQAVAEAVIALRQGDGASPDPDTRIDAHMESAAPGRHREDPLNRTQGFLGARYGLARPFAVTTFLPLAKPPALGSAAYLADLVEVADKGAAPGATTRTADETIQGLYWAYDGVEQIGTPPRLYNQVLREVIKPLGLSTEQLARLFFLANVAMGDSGVLAWFYKYDYDLWRPVVGIREHDSGMGPAATAGSNPVVAPCDPFWRPLGAPRTNDLGAMPAHFTPSFPAYPSGHATFGAAAFQAGRLYLASIGKAVIAPDGTDNLAFKFVSDELDGKSVDADGNLRPRHLRQFSGLHEAIYENSVSRVFLGVHWRFDGTTGHNATQMLANAVTDNIGGVALGLAIANDLLAQGSNVRPTPATVKPPPFTATPW